MQTRIYKYTFYLKKKLSTDDGTNKGIDINNLEENDVDFFCSKLKVENHPKDNVVTKKDNLMKKVDTIYNILKKIGTINFDMTYNGEKMNAVTHTSARRKKEIAIFMALHEDEDEM